MNLKQVIETLNAVPLYSHDGWQDENIDGVFASDLISDILVSEGEDQLLLTSLTSPQVVRTAALIGAVAVVLVHRRQTPDVLKVAATEQDMPLFRSAMTKYDACIKLGHLEEECE